MIHLLYPTKTANQDSPVHAHLSASMEVRFGHLWRIWGASGAGRDYARAQLKGSGLSGIVIKTPIPLILLWYILVCILSVSASQHVCGVGYANCSPARLFHRPRLAMIPTLELHFAFHRAFMNLYHEQKFGATPQKETTSTRFFERLVRKGKKTSDSKGRWKRSSAFFTSPLT
ncbi:hypothetical protein EDD85DRAFT_871762 [Armillaria nabsnona]|nr:hypothetical protein EDD85DRAFT_871762 [Armillaria nabsnona]